MSIVNKSIADLMSDIRGRHRSYAIQYEQSIEKRKSASNIRFLRQCKNTYYDLFDVLRHFNDYKQLIDREKCMMCCFDAQHILTLRTNLAKWKHLILRCKDGANFVKPTSKSQPMDQKA